MTPWQQQATVTVLLAIAGARAGAQEPPKPEEIAQTARLVEAAGDPGTAAELFARLAAQQPGNWEWVAAAVRCYCGVREFNNGLGVLDRARPHFDDPVEVDALRAKTFQLKAEDMVAHGIRDDNMVFQFERSAEIAEAALQQHPERRDLRLLLAQALYQLGDMDKAQVEAEQAIERFPRHAGGYILVGKIAFQEFLDLRRRIRDQEPDSAAAAELLAKSQAVRDRATTAFEKAITVDPDRALPYMQLGNIAAWLGDIDRALGRYEEAMTRDPEIGIDHLWLRSRVSAGRRFELYTRATQAYLAAPDADPRKVATINWHRAYSLYEIGEFKQAYVLFDSIADIDSRFATARSFAMLASYWDGNHDNAEHQAARLARESPKKFADHIRVQDDREEILKILEFLAARSLKAGRKAHSRDINHVLAMVLSTVDHWNNYAFLCRETKEFAEALSGYENALSLDPDSPQLLNDTGVVLQYHLESQENLRRARTYYQRAIARADERLAAGGASPAETVRMRQAKADAIANLAAMDK